MKNVLSLLLGLNLILTGLASAAADLPLKQFAQPDRIHYDGHCLTIDGQDTLIFSGAFHYFRCPKELWRSRFQKIKEAGFNAVESYVPWNWHERAQPAGLDDFSKVDLTDLKDWLKMAEEEFGLYVIIRPGPYICAEWDGGGYPRWLLNFKPDQPRRTDMWLRSDDATYLAWSKHWYDAVCPVLAAEQLTHKAKGAHGIILFQIENEYDFNTGTREEKENHLRALYQCAKADGIEVPIMTCWTKEIRGSTDPLLSQVFDGPNEYPRWNVKNVYRDVLKAKNAQPNAPGMVPELQGGWFSQIGGVLSEDQDGVTAAEINGVTLMAYAGGATITSYYMLHGGIHVDGWGARSLTTSYDYNAPIREHGGVGDRYYAVAAIGNLVKKYGPAIARSDLVNCTWDATDKNLDFMVRRNPNGQTFVFCFNSDRSAPRQGEVVLKPDSGDAIPVKYHLEPFGMKVLCLPSGEWQPQPVTPPERPADPAPVRIASALTHAETASQGWRPVKDGDSLPSLGVFDTRFVLYRTHFSLTAEQLTNLPALQLSLFRADNVVVSVNGRLLQNDPAGGRQKNFDAENGALLKRAAQNQKNQVLNLAGCLHTGDNNIVLLYENAGQSNGGKGMEELAGLVSGQLCNAIPSGQPLVNWRAHLATDDGMSLTGVDVDDSAWGKFTLRQDIKGAAGHVLDDHQSTAVFRTTVELTAADLSPNTRLRFDSIDDAGTVYVNGQAVGQSSDWSEPFEKDVTPYLKVGRNVIAVIVTNKDGVGGLTKPARLYAQPITHLALAWELAPALDGVAAQWYSPANVPSGWTNVPLDVTNPLAVKQGDMPAGPATDLATWYRLEFTLPAAAPNTWAPWGVVLAASGNGWIYLNDHPLGRYWEAGPQRKFYLPECWLKTGTGEKNVLALCLRPLGKGAVLSAAEVAPYAGFAEKR